MLKMWCQPFWLSLALYCSPNLLTKFLLGSQGPCSWGCVGWEWYYLTSADFNQGLNVRISQDVWCRSVGIIETVFAFFSSNGFSSLSIFVAQIFHKFCQRVELFACSAALSSCGVLSRTAINATYVSLWSNPCFNFTQALISSSLVSLWEDQSLVSISFTGNDFRFPISARYCKLVYLKVTNWCWHWYLDGLAVILTLAAVTVRN